jgi:hypothetical protein
MTTNSFVQYDVLKNLVYFKGTPDPGLTNTITENSNNISSIKGIIQNSTTGQLNLLPTSASLNIKNFVATVPEISLANSRYVTLNIEIIDDISIGNVYLVSKNLDNTKTYATKGGSSLIISIDVLKPTKKWPTMGKCKNCLKILFQNTNIFNFTGNIGGTWDGTWRNNQKVYDVNIPTFATPQSFGAYTNYKIFWRPNTTYSGLDYNGNAINIVNKHKWICVPSSSIGTVNELSNTTFFHVLNDFSASCAYAPPSTTWYNFFGKNGFFLLSNTPLPTIQSDTSQKEPCPTFSPTPGTVNWGYNCGPNGCVASPSGSIGTYATLELCTGSCIPDYGWNCTHTGCVTGSANNPGFYSTLMECQTSCTSDYGWNCTAAGCVPGTQANPGIYTTLAQCETNCSTKYGYNCVNGNCIPGTSTNPGIYDTIVECSTSCTASYGWNCTPNGCVLGNIINTGSYATQAECELLCFDSPVEPTYCNCKEPNLVTNGDFANGSTGWNFFPQTYTPGIGILDLSGQVTAGVSSAVQFNSSNTSSMYLSQPNVFTPSCSYQVCFQAWANTSPANDPNATIILDDGNYPLNPGNNALSGLTTIPTAYTINLNNINTNDLTFYFGFPSGSTASNAEINIDNICITLLGCPPEPIVDCIITGSASNYEDVEYDCICPEGYAPDGNGNCITTNQPMLPISMPTSSYDGTYAPNIFAWSNGQGYSLLQPPTPTSQLNTPLWYEYTLPTVILGNASLYYQYNFNGTGNSSTGNPSPIAGNPNIYKTQYTFDILKSNFFSDPPATGNPPFFLNPNGNGSFLPYNFQNWNGSPQSNIYPYNPVPANPFNNWITKRVRYANPNSTLQSMWYGCGTAVEVSPTTKTYHLLIVAARQYKIKLNGVTLLTTGTGQFVQNSFPFSGTISNTNYPVSVQQYYARWPASATTGLGTIPSPIYGFNPYINLPISGNLGWLKGSSFLTNYTSTFSTGISYPSLYGPFSFEAGKANPCIYPITIPSGSCGLINVEVRPADSCDEDEWMAAVLFDNTAVEIADATSINDLNIIWDTSYLPDLRTLPNNVTNFPTMNALPAQNPLYFYGYLPLQEPSPTSYIPVCPTGSVPISGSACNGCTSLSQVTSSIPCGSCLECTHGRLYNGYAVDKGGFTFQGRGPGGIVNTGSINATTWVIPTESDWNTLVTFLNNGIAPTSVTITGSLGTISGGKMKDYTRDLNSSCWENPNIGSQTITGSSGWAGTAGGRRKNDGVFEGLGFEGLWWSANSLSTPPVTNGSLMATRRLKYYSADVYRDILSKNYGCSIRLVRPAITGENDGTYIPDAYVGNDGTFYDGIVIGTQVWINKNLSETLYNNASSISLTTSNTTWTSAITTASPTSCYYNNDIANASITKGNINPATSECYTLPTYYSYQKCDGTEFIVQTLSGSTTSVGKTQKDSNGDCWSYFEDTQGIPSYATSIYTGNYFTGSNIVYNNCSDCEAIHTIYMKFGTKNC